MDLLLFLLCLRTQFAPCIPTLCCCVRWIQCVAFSTFSGSTFLKHNAFVKRWHGRFSRIETRAAEEKRRSEAGEEVIKKDPPRGILGDVEWACYESWVVACKAGDRTDMIHAIKHAMAEEF